MKKRTTRKSSKCGKVPDFPDWLKITEPQWTWDWRHQLFIYEKLAAVTSGEQKRLMIFLPPRHSKSETVTVRYSAWRLEKEPKMNIILGSYNQKLANRFSRKIRRIAEARIELSTTRKAADEWETDAGGGVRAVGAGAGVTGFGAGLIVIDDPVKNRAEAESSTFRERVWDWFNDDIYTRLEPGGAIVLIQTRWHEDDLAGRLLASMKNGGERWEVVCLPALAEAGRMRIAECGMRNEEEERSEVEIETVTEKTHQQISHSAIRIPHSTDPIGRAEGEALCPERFDREALLRIKQQLGSYSFAALYQQTPVPSEGGLFKRAWFTKFVNAIPRNLSWVRGYDLAVSIKTSADFTASIRCAFDRDGNLFLADGFRERIEYPEQRRYVLDRMKSEKRTTHAIEKALHGDALVQDIRRGAGGLRAPLKAVRTEGDKYTRALTWANLAEDGKVIIVRGGWVDAFIEEACSFPGGRHDDQIDAVSLAVKMLSTKTTAAGF
ncbi:MAG: phage terminase large subunit [Acidobacteriota bacterium]